MMNKEIGRKLDTEVWEKVISTIKINNQLMTAMTAYSDLQIAERDFYNGCESVSEYVKFIYDSYPTNGNKNANAYIQSCKNFTIYVQITATSLKKYIDSKDTKDLSKVQKNIDETQRAILMAGRNRGTFLKKVGYTNEEIKKLVDKIDEELVE